MPRRASRAVVHAGLQRPNVRRSPRFHFADRRVCRDRHGQQLALPLPRPRIASWAAGMVFRASGAPRVKLEVPAFLRMPLGAVRAEQSPALCMRRRRAAARRFLSVAIRASAGTDARPVRSEPSRGGRTMPPQPSTESPDRPTDLRQDLAAVWVAMAIEREGALRARQQAQLRAEEWRALRTDAQRLVQAFGWLRRRPGMGARVASGARLEHSYSGVQASATVAVPPGRLAFEPERSPVTMQMIV